MPELPEVETTLRGIKPYIKNSIVERVEIRQRKLRWPITRNLASRISGEPILDVTRRAKYLLLTFPYGTLMIHLGMSGRLNIVPESSRVGKHDHVDLILSSGSVLRFNDPRRFGSILWTSSDPFQTPQLAHLGPEPFDTSFSGDALFKVTRGKRSSVKNFIMDGRVVVGVGNIYANEALFRSGIAPRRLIRNISLHRYRRLVVAIQDVLSDAIEAGGTTLRDYSQVTGEPGYFKQDLLVYNRAGQPCSRCNSIIRSRVISQRSSYYCPNCQR